MKLALDTNVLIRIFVRDDEKQYAAATRAVEEAESVFISNTTLCELVWVLQRSYGIDPQDVAAAILSLLDSARTQIDKAAVEAGLAMMERGGDFADGVVAQEGRSKGEHVFASFDKKAIKGLLAEGLKAKQL